MLWLDALTANVDRSWRNPNLLVWHGDLWAIDHGACLYFHHGWSGGVGSAARFAAQPYDAGDHELTAYLPGVAAADAALAPRVDRDLLQAVLAEVPDGWLDEADGGPDATRTAYVEHLLARLAAREAWVPT